MSNVLLFPVRPSRETYPAPCLETDDALENDIKRIRVSADVLGDQLRCQEDFVTKIGAMLKRLPDGPVRRNLHGRLVLIDLQIMEAFALRDTVVRALDEPPSDIRPASSQ